MNQNEFDFFDFGCGDGANMNFVKSIQPSLRGLGFDIDPKKVSLATAAGHKVANQDILALPPNKIVDFVAMSHFLEHLPNVSVAKQMIKKGIEVARQFVLIRQPWFDSDGFLLSKGVKLYWSDWTGHPNRMTSLDFYLILRQAISMHMISGYTIYGRGRLRSSADSTIIPITAPIDQHDFDPKVHGSKSEFDFHDVPAFKEIVVSINISNNTMERQLLGALGPLELLIKS